MNNEKSLWSNRNYILLFSAQIVSLLGSGVTTVGLALFAYQIIGGESATAVIGNALFLRILAFLLFSQPAGILADYFDRKTILITADLIRFALLALFPFITEVWQIYLLIFLINSATAFFTPTFESSIPAVVGEENYVKALTYSRVAVDIEAVAAPAIAGFLIVLMGVRWVFLFDAITYLFSALLVLSVVIPQLKPQEISFSIRNLWTELTIGTKIIIREPSLRQAIILSFAEALAGAAAIVATVVYVKEILGFGDLVFAFVMAGLGLGSTITAIILGQFTGRYESKMKPHETLHAKRHSWTRFSLISGGLILGIILLPSFWQPPAILFGLMWFFNGTGQALIAISSTTLLAEHTDETERGRAYAAHFALTHAFWLITYPLIGYSASNFQVTTTFTLAGIVCLLITMLAFYFGRGANTSHSH